MKKSPPHSFWIAVLTFLIILSTYQFLDLFIKAPPILGDDQGVTRQEWITTLSKEEPPIILIGNSLLDEGVDGYMLSNKMHERAVKLCGGGMDSAWWYLTFKNVVLQAHYTPHMVYFFFRDYELTTPDSRVTGQYAVALHAMSSADESLFNQLAYPRRIDHWRLYMQQHWKLYRDMPLFQKSLNNTIKEYAAALVGVDILVLNQAIHRVFEDVRMDPILLTHAQAQGSAPSKDLVHTSFNRQVEHSFLPAIISLAKSHHIPLTFVRMKTRDQALTGRQPPELIRYQTALRGYLHQAGCDVMDWSDDPRIEITEYAIGDHFSRKQGRPLFTALLADSILAQRHPVRD